jgi:hypothetical protein
MIDIVLFALTLLAAIGCGLIAGVFFAFSAFVMAALVARFSQIAGYRCLSRVDGVEPRADGRRPPGGGIVHDRAVLAAATGYGRGQPTMTKSRLW